MKLTVSILVLLTGSAAAEGVTLSPVAPHEAPNVVGSEAVCKDTNDRLRVSKTKLDGHEVQVLHQCGATDLGAELAFETKDGWRFFDGGLIAYQAGNMTDAPLHVSLLSETTSLAKLKSRKVLVHRVDTSHRAIRSDGTVESETRKSHVDVCAFDKDGGPSCGSAEVDCPETGCRAPEIIKDSLWLHAKGGRKKFTITNAK